MNFPTKKKTMRSKTTKSTAQDSAKGVATASVLSPLTPTGEPSPAPTPAPAAGDATTGALESPTEGEGEGDTATDGTTSSEVSTALSADNNAKAATSQPPAEQSESASQEVDLYEWDHTLITVTLSLLPGEEHPDGRPVALSIHSPGEVPLFRAPLRFSDLTLEQIHSLIDEYRETLPERKEQREAREQEKKAAAQTTQSGYRGRKSDLSPPGEHLKGTKAKATETFNERSIGLFG